MSLASHVDHTFGKTCTLQSLWDHTSWDHTFGERLQTLISLGSHVWSQCDPIGIRDCNLLPQRPLWHCWQCHMQPFVAAIGVRAGYNFFGQMVAPWAFPSLIIGAVSLTLLVRDIYLNDIGTDENRKRPWTLGWSSFMITISVDSPVLPYQVGEVFPLSLVSLSSRGNGDVAPHRCCKHFPCFPWWVWRRSHYFWSAW